MKIRVYYNLYNSDNTDYETLTTICNEEEFLTLEVIPS